MTVKEFFKGKAFKCIIVLTCIMLISGILLSVCWGFLEVTDEERFARKIGSVYGGETVTSTEQDIADKNTSVSGAQIQKVWLIEEKKDYLVQAASQGNGGSVTCWVAVSMDDNLKSVEGIAKVLVYSVADAAEYVMNIGDEVYEKFVTDYEDGKVFDYGNINSDEYIYTGASSTLSAICKCVNGSVEFIKAYAGGGSVVDPYEAYVLRNSINMDATTWTVENGVVSYTVVTNKFFADPFTITLKVGADKKVANFTITENGSTTQPYDYASLMDESVLNGSLFNGKELAFFTGVYGNDMAYTPVTGVNGDTIVTGATTTSSYASKSTYLCASAAAFALANYDECVKAPKGGN